MKKKGLLFFSIIFLLFHASRMMIVVAETVDQKEGNLTVVVPNDIPVSTKTSNKVSKEPTLPTTSSFGKLGDVSSILFIILGFFLISLVLIWLLIIRRKKKNREKNFE